MPVQSTSCLVFESEELTSISRRRCICENLRCPRNIFLLFSDLQAHWKCRWWKERKLIHIFLKIRLRDTDGRWNTNQHFSNGNLSILKHLLSYEYCSRIGHLWHSCRQLSTQKQFIESNKYPQLFYPEIWTSEERWNWEMHILFAR